VSKVASPTTQLALALVSSSCSGASVTHARGSRRAHTQRPRARCWRPATGGPRKTTYRPFFDKPVPFHQLRALAMRTFSDREFAIRIVPATAGLALVAIWLCSARRCGRLRSDRPGALTLASNPRRAGRELPALHATASRINRATPSTFKSLRKACCRGP